MLGVSGKGDLLTPERGGGVLPRMACQRSSAQKGYFQSDFERVGKFVI